MDDYGYLADDVSCTCRIGDVFMNEQFKEIFKKIAVLPYEKYSAETDLMIGAIGLEMNAVYSRLYQMQMEYSHAEEYLKDKRINDIEETMQEYRDMLKLMEKRILGSQKNLLECTDKDEAVRQVICEFLTLFIRKLVILEQTSSLSDSEKGISEQISEYQKNLESACNISREYIRLHVGDTSYIAD